MKNTIQIYPPNSEVLVAGDLQGLVQGVLIEQDKITYKVSWWVKDHRTEAWLAPVELSPLPKTQKQSVHKLLDR